MPKTKHTTDNAKIAAAVLRLAATKGWTNVTVEAVAVEAKTPLAQLKQSFAAPADLVPLVVEEITRQALIASAKPAGQPHDILFDLLMARFDALQKNRKAILSITAAARHDRILSRALACAALAGISATVEAANIDTPPRPVLIAGLSAVYTWAFLAWRRDESRDMSKTMVALDKALRLAGKTLSLLKRRS